MNRDRKIAIWVGLLFIVATISGIISISLSAPIVGADNYLNSAYLNVNTIRLSVIFELVMALSIAAIPIVIYPVLSRFSKGLSIGYICARVVEVLFYIVDATILLTLSSLSKLTIEGKSSDYIYYETIGEVLKSANEWSGHVILDIGVFGVSALILYGLFFKTRLVPRWLSLWGLIGAIFYIAAAVLVLYGQTPLSTILIVLSIPLALNEMVLAIWLIVKGFATID